MGDSLSYLDNLLIRWNTAASDDLTDWRKKNYSQWMSRVNVVRMAFTLYSSCSLQTSLLVGLLYYSWLSMDGNTTSSPSSTASLNPPPLSSLDATILVLFGVIAASSFVFNLLFCIVLLRKPSMLRKPHNILLFSLAVADMLTGEIPTN